MKKIYNWLITLGVTLFFLPFASKDTKAKNIEYKKQTKEEIFEIQKNTPLILKHAKELFLKDELKFFAGHRSHSSHHSHYSHRSSTTYTPPKPKSSPTSESQKTGSSVETSAPSKSKPEVAELISSDDVQDKINKEDIKKADITLEGIYADKKGKNLAIINGEVYYEGDSVGDAKVEKINEHSVELIINGEKIILKVGSSFTNLHN